MNFLVNLALQSYEIRRIQLLPGANIGEITEQIIELRREIIVNSQSCLNKLLITPQNVLKTLRDPVDVHAKSSQGGRHEQPSGQFRDFEPIPRAGTHVEFTVLSFKPSPPRRWEGPYAKTLSAMN